MGRPDNYWLTRLKADRRLAERAQAEVEAEVKRALRSQYLQVARRLDSLYAEAQSRGTLSRTKLWNYRAYRDLEAELRQYCEAGAVIQIDAITKACDKVFRDVIGVDVGSVDRGKFILPYSPRAVIDTAWSGESFSTRVWGNTEELARRIRGEAQQMVMGLKSPATVKQQLMKDYDVSFRQASRLVDTELSYVLNKANLEEYRRRGRKKLTITNLDVNTCDKCKALEGEVFFTEDVPVLPIHPRCHCAYCVPDDLDAAEVTASGEDLDAVYARKGVKGYGDQTEGGDALKQYVPKQQRAAEVARANGLIPVSELQAKVEKAMAQTAPELAENGAAAAGEAPIAAGEMTTAAGEMPTAAGEMPTDRKEVLTETLSTFGAPAKPDDVGVFGMDGIGAEAAAAIAEAQAGNPEKPDGVGILGLQAGAENGIIEPESPPKFTTEDEVKKWIASAACSKVLRKGRQRVHIPGTKEYEDNVAKYARRGEHGPSTLSITEAEAEALGVEYMGTGKPFISQKGWDGTETITANEKTIGTVVNNLSGAQAETTVFKIHYSGRGFHITPDYPSKKQKGG